MEEGAFALCMDLVVSNSAEVQVQATRALGNLALTEAAPLVGRMVDEGVLELLVLLAASWDESVQLEAAVALSNIAQHAQHRTAVVQAGAVGPLVEQLSSTDAAVQYHAAQGLLSLA